MKAIIYVFLNISLICSATAQDATSEIQLKTGLKFSYKKPDPFEKGEVTHYNIELQKKEGGVVSFKMKYKGKNFDKIVTDYVCMIDVTDNALQNSNLYTGSFSSAAPSPDYPDLVNELKEECPEFLFSAKSFSGLTTKNEMTLKTAMIENDPGVVYQKTEKAALKIKVNGKEKEVKCVVAVHQGSEFSAKLTVWLLDNPSCPLLLKRTTDFGSMKSVDYELMEITY
ncbi:hypothetical protein HUU42_04715 [bacterium]|nr:hypothetical protein [bacterium]